MQPLFESATCSRWRTSFKIVIIPLRPNKERIAHQQTRKPWRLQFHTFRSHFDPQHPSLFPHCEITLLGLQISCISVSKQLRRPWLAYPRCCECPLNCRDFYRTYSLSLSTSTEPEQLLRRLQLIKTKGLKLKDGRLRKPQTQPFPAICSSSSRASCCPNYGFSTLDNSRIRTVFPGAANVSAVVARGRAMHFENFHSRQQFSAHHLQRSAFRLQLRTIIERKRK